MNGHITTTAGKNLRNNETTEKSAEDIKDNSIFVFENNQHEWESLKLKDELTDGLKDTEINDDKLKEIVYRKLDTRRGWQPWNYPS